MLLQIFDQRSQRVGFGQQVVSVALQNGEVLHAAVAVQNQNSREIQTITA